MMKSEFENLAGREVTDEQYRAIETLYMSSNLEKTEFVKSMKPILKNIPQPERKKDIKRMVVRDRSGYRKTPNGCYYHIEYVELVDIDIKTGKYIIKPLEEKDFEQLKKTLDGQTARMKEIKQLYDSSAAFQNLKPVYDGLQKIKFEKPRAKYKAEHETELKQFYAARRKLTGEFPDGKVDMKKLTEEYDELEQAHETTYGEFKTVRDDLHRLWKVKSCVDTATRFNERAEEQKLQNRPQTRHKKEELSR